MGNSTGSSATLLFESDFGGTVAIGTPVQISTASPGDSTNGYWPIVGGDDGFSWPISFNGGTSPGLQPISYGPTVYYDAADGTIDCGASPCTGLPIWTAEIIQGTRHDGTTGPMLHQANAQNVVWQMPYVILPAADVIDQYQKVWMMFPADLAQQIGPNGWRAFWEWKDSGYTSTSCPLPGYRIALYIYTDGNGNPFWDMHGDNCPSTTAYWEQTSQAPVPLGQWVELEWAWHRAHDSTAWTWLKMNGTTILSQQGGGTNSNGFYNGDYPLNREFFFQIYGGSGASEQWVDHVEIWTRYREPPLILKRALGA